MGDGGVNGAPPPSRVTCPSCPCCSSPSESSESSVSGQVTPISGGAVLDRR